MQLEILEHQNVTLHFLWHLGSLEELRFVYAPKKLTTAKTPPKAKAAPKKKTKVSRAQKPRVKAPMQLRAKSEPKQKKPKVSRPVAAVAGQDSEFEARPLNCKLDSQLHRNGIFWV